MNMSSRTRDCILHRRLSLSTSSLKGGSFCLTPVNVGNISDSKSLLPEELESLLPLSDLGAAAAAVAAAFTQSGRLPTALDDGVFSGFVLRFLEFN